MKQLVTHAGQLDERLSILRCIEAPNTYNELIETWSTYVTVWTNHIDATVGETLRAAEVGAKISAHFTIRYSPETKTITPKDRLLFENKIFDIIGMRELQRNHWLEIHAVARPDLNAPQLTPENAIVDEAGTVWASDDGDIMIAG
jgi:SPP1 family predicted phage head-tail adaptor